MKAEIQGFYPAFSVLVDPAEELIVNAFSKKKKKGLSTCNS